MTGLIPTEGSSGFRAIQQRPPIHLDGPIVVLTSAEAGIALDRIIFQDPRQTCTVDQAIVPGICNPLAVVDPAISEFYRKLTVSCKRSDRKPRLYIARSVANAFRKHGRVMLNELVNAAFCRPGTKIIDIESEPHWALPIRCLLDSSKLRHTVFEAMAEDQNWSIHHKPFRVNIPALVERVTTM